MAHSKVLLTDYAWPDLALEHSLFKRAGIELVVAPDQQPATLTSLATGVDAILTCWAPVTREVIDAAKQLKIVSRLGIGLDNIDVAHCTSRGIVVTNVPGYCQTEVAEHTMALVLALGRKVAHYHLQTKQGIYQLQSGPTLRRIAGQTLGIVGLGRIGQLVAEKASALGLKLIGVSRSRPQLPQVIRYCQLDELLAASDYVSLHLPLSHATERLIGARELAQMKSTAYLINTARGGLVDHQALAAALENGQLAGAALDVQVPEPPDLSQPPYNDPRVIVTPHAAFYSRESVDELRRRATQQVIHRLSGNTPDHVVNPQVLA